MEKKKNQYQKKREKQETSTNLEGTPAIGSNATKAKKKAGQNRKLKTNGKIKRSSRLLTQIISKITIMQLIVLSCLSLKTKYSLGYFYADDCQAKSFATFFLYLIVGLIQSLLV